MENKMLNLISDIDVQIKKGKNIIIGGNSNKKSLIRNSLIKISFLKA